MLADFCAGPLPAATPARLAIVRRQQVRHLLLSTWGGGRGHSHRSARRGVVSQRARERPACYDGLFQAPKGCCCAHCGGWLLGWVVGCGSIGVVLSRWRRRHAVSVLCVTVAWCIHGPLGHGPLDDDGGGRFCFAQMQKSRFCRSNLRLGRLQMRGENTAFLFLTPKRHARFALAPNHQDRKGGERSNGERVVGFLSEAQQGTQQKAGG